MTHTILHALSQVAQDAIGGHDEDTSKLRAELNKITEEELGALDSESKKSKVLKVGAAVVSALKLGRDVRDAIKEVRKLT